VGKEEDENGSSSRSMACLPIYIPTLKLLCTVIRLLLRLLQLRLLRLSFPYTKEARRQQISIELSLAQLVYMLPLAGTASAS